MAEHVALATGGAITYVDKTTNTYSVIHKFTVSGTFTKSTNKAINGYYLIVAGGGAGGNDDGAGGGGAGGLLTNWGGSAVALVTSTVTVGAGGQPYDGDNMPGHNGGNSSYNGITAIGGGGGCGGDQAGGHFAGNGGSGGGGSRANENGGGSGTSGQGNDGGSSGGYGPHGYENARDYGSGGGGAGGVGGDGWMDWSGGSQTKYYNGGSGGSGRQLDISGTVTYYAAGGQGGFSLDYNSTRFSRDGIGGMGGQRDAGAATAGATNTGSGGGGGGRQSTRGAAGGSGIVILRYDVTRYLTTKTATTNGKINGTSTQSSQWVTAGESANYTITPNANYYISQITGVASSLNVTERNNGKTLTIAPLSDTTLGATFALKPYMTISCGSGGTIKIGNNSATSGYVDYGVSKTYTITANSGYTILSLKVNGVENITGRGITTKSITMTPTSNASIAVTFVADVQVTISTNGRGSVTPGSGKVSYGVSCTYLISPDRGHIIKSVTINGVAQTLSKQDKKGTSITIVPTAATTITVIFKPATNFGETLYWLMD